MSSQRRIAVQVGSASFKDEGVESVLDTLQSRAAANTVFIATPTWSRETGGRARPGYADHGIQVEDSAWVGGNYATVHPEYYRDSQLGAVGKAPDHGEWDVFDAVIPEARKRGVETFALMDESSSALELRRYANFLKCMEVDMWNKPARRPCYRNPDYRNWHLSMVEDYIKSYDLNGISWRAERPGPLNLLVQGRSIQGLGLISCFCSHCLAVAKDLGIDWHSAQEGFRKLVQWNAAVADGNRPTDGAFSTFWRLILQYPDTIAWQAMWTDGQRQLYRDIFGTARAFKPEMEIGWDLDQNITFSPFDRAGQDFADLSHICDFLKISTYNASGGAAFAAAVDNFAHAIFGDVSQQEAYPLVQKMLGLDEGELSAIASDGLSAEYVRRETARSVKANEGRCVIYAGIDIDIPIEVEPGRLVSRSTAEQVEKAVVAAFEGGASGVVLSRKYAEMRLENLSAVGAALQQIR